ncbi:ABC transporter permease [Arthrobacter sp. KNU40]|uniref:ABC transporter permease n=1 Tax=Arthrobacter sp. KNU40 TaxID=3447965 RepID=UPI003F618282
MMRFLFRRTVFCAALLAVICVLAFTLLHIGSGDIARHLLGQSASEQAVRDKAAALGLDQPLWSQFADWLAHAAAGDLGSSWFTGQPVTDALGARLPVTLALVISTTLLSALISLALGVLAARRGGWVDRLVQVIGVLGFAIPGFLVALGLAVVFAVNLGWFKPTGYVPFLDSPAGWLSSVTLPVAALTIGTVAGVSQQVRGSVLDAQRQDYVRTLLSRGIPLRRVVYGHILKNASGPALSVLALNFIGLLGGTFIVEQVFAIPGLGQIAVTATSQGDIPMVMGLVIVTAVIVVAVNLIIDLLQGWINPKVRLQ